MGSLSPKRPAPVEVLASSGYNTAGFSTNPHVSINTAYNRGYHQFIDFVPTERETKLRNIKGGQFLLRKPFFHSLMSIFGVKTRPVRLYSPASEITDSVIDWLQDANTPFFVWLHYMDVHWPYFIEENLVKPIEIAQAWQDMRKKQPQTEELIERYKDFYQQSLMYLDNQIGRLIEQLFKSGKINDTIIIIIADHGEEFMEHGRIGHKEMNLFDEIIKVPLIIHLPNQQHSQVIRHQVRTLDIMPTILELCGSERGQKLEGQSFVSLFTDNGRTYNVQEVISEMPRPNWYRIAVRTDTFKYIWDDKYPEQSELYDLKNDPAERVEISADHPELVRQFQDVVDQHLDYIAQISSEDQEPALKYDAAMVRRLQDLGYLD
jgi:arylsulfatase A-like enzyme